MNHSAPHTYPWQAHQWLSVQALIDADRMPHALLLSGAPGIGKQDFANALAAQLLCDKPSASGACGECRACNLRATGSHPDYRVVGIEEGKKQIAVDQVRSLVSFTQKTSFEQGRKVAVLSPAEAMNQNTANALLKTLEEPSGETVLILICDSPSLLLPTVRSRCRHIEFPLPDQSVARKWLALQAGNDTRAEELLGEADGRPLAAAELLVNDGLARFSALDDSLAAYANQATLMQAAQALAEEDLATVLLWWSNRVQRLCRAIASPAEAERLPKQWQQWRGLNASELNQFWRDVCELRTQLLRGGSPNPRMTLEGLLLDWRALL